jgi:hypothetical protein
MVGGCAHSKCLSSTLSNGSCKVPKFRNLPRPPISYHHSLHPSSLTLRLFMTRTKGEDSNKVAAKSAHKAPTKAPSKVPANVKAVTRARAAEAVKANKVVPKPGTATAKKGGGAAKANKVPVGRQTRLQAKNGNIDMNDPDSEVEGTGKVVAPADGDDDMDDEGENHIPSPKPKRKKVSPPGQNKLASNASDGDKENNNLPKTAARVYGRLNPPASPVTSEQNAPRKSRSPVPLGAMANSREAFLERQIAELKSELGESFIKRSAYHVTNR